MLTSQTERKLRKWGWGLHLGGLLIAGGSCGLMFRTVIFPLMQENTEVVAREVELRKILDLDATLIQEHQRLTQILEEADQKIKSLLDRIPNVARESDFLGQITTLAKEVGVEIMDYHPGQISEKDDYHEMTLTLTSQGSYEGVCNFLHRLHNLPRLSRANKMSVLPVFDGNTCSLDMTLTIYFSPNSQLASAAKEADHG